MHRKITVDRKRVQNLLLIMTGGLVILWATVRACLQSVTFDEAFSYLFFAKSFGLLWTFHSNNHLLNSLLMWSTTHVLGPSHITLRIPALLGAVVYVSVCYFLCKRIAKPFTLRWALFICLTCNPFILDFMVAARGYSLANGFFVAAIACPVLYRRNGLSLCLTCAFASVALGLSLSANFSFGFVDTMAFFAIVTWAIHRRKTEGILRVVGSCALPGLFVALAICGYPLGKWHISNWKTDLWWGAHSVKEMTDSLVKPSLYQVSRRVFGVFYENATSFAPYLLVGLGVLCFCQLVVIGLDRSWFRHPRSRWMAQFALILAFVGASSIGISWAEFRLYGLPLPMGRTGIYLVPLATLLAGVIAAAPGHGLPGRCLRRGITAVLVCLACWFLLCLRVSYFNEYQWNADVQEVYSVLTQLNHEYGVEDVESAATYVTSLNYYREVSGKESFKEFKIDTPEASAGRSIYVLDGGYWRTFIDQEKLGVIYRGYFSNVVVAVKSGGAIPATAREAK